MDLDKSVFKDSNNKENNNLGQVENKKSKPNGYKIAMILIAIIAVVAIVFVLGNGSVFDKNINNTELQENENVNQNEDTTNNNNTEDEIDPENDTSTKEEQSIELKSNYLFNSTEKSYDNQINIEKRLDAIDSSKDKYDLSINKTINIENEQELFLLTEPGIDAYSNLLFVQKLLVGSNKNAARNFYDYYKENGYIDSANIEEKFEEELDRNISDFTFDNYYNLSKEHLVNSMLDDTNYSQTLKLILKDKNKQLRNITMITTINFNQENIDYSTFEYNEQENKVKARVCDEQEYCMDLFSKEEYINIEDLPNNLWKNYRIENPPIFE